MRILIDGYNLLMQTPDLCSLALEEARDELIGRLAHYKRLKGHHITVVFDGRGSGRLSPSGGRQRGIEVVFTAREDADTWIKRRVSGEGMVVVSSDRGIRDHVEGMGAVAVTSTEFLRRMEAAFLEEFKGEGEADPLEQPSRRLPKKQRRRLRVLAKL